MAEQNIFGLIGNGVKTGSDAVASVLFYDILGFPFIVLWLIGAGLFFTFYLRGVNVRLLPLALRVAQGKTGTRGHGEVGCLSALASALAATVGLGSIAGVSVGIAIGGPGAVLWILFAGILAMATKYAEVCLSLCYRRIDADGKVFGGPFRYIGDGLAERGLGWLGKPLGILFALFCLGGALGGGNMFQSNQAVKILTQTVPGIDSLDWVVALGFAALVMIVLLGSIRRIARVADFIVPLKGGLYLLCALIVLGYHHDRLLPSLALIVQDAFNGQAAAGGLIGMIAVAFKRASFANEAGLGSAPIAHAAAKTDEPVEEAALALLEPLLAALVGVLTGLIVVVSGAYAGADVDEGVLIAGRAFASVGGWFTYFLAANVLIFAYSTTIGWSYYGEIAWSHLFGRRGIRLYQAIFCAAAFLGGVLDFEVVLGVSDLLILGMAFPNLIAVFLLRSKVRDETGNYAARQISGKAANTMTIPASEANQTIERTSGTPKT